MLIRKLCVAVGADGIPILLRACVGKGFEKGPFRLGSLQLPANLLATAWVIISAVSYRPWLLTYPATSPTLEVHQFSEVVRPRNTGKQLLIYVPTRGALCWVAFAMTVHSRNTLLARICSLPTRACQGPIAREFIAAVSCMHAEYLTPLHYSQPDLQYLCAGGVCVAD